MTIISTRLEQQFFEHRVLW